MTPTEQESLEQGVNKSNSRVEQQQINVSSLQSQSREEWVPTRYIHTDWDEPGITGIYYDETVKSPIAAENWLRIPSITETF